MQRRTLLVLLVAVVGIATGAVTAIPQADSTTTTPQTTAAGSSAAGGDAGTDLANYTRLYIQDRYQNLRLKPGESDTVSVTVENGEDEAVDLSPQVATSPTRSQPPIKSEWVSIAADEMTLEAGDSETFEVTVDIPESAEVGDYSGRIAFTDETIRYPGRPPQPVHSTGLSVEVWQEPTVEINSETHIYTQLKTGETFSREISVRNTGEEAVPVNPQLSTEAVHRRRPGRETLDRSWVSFDAPSEIAPGETETITISITPPADADRGDYSAAIDLGIKDPARATDRAYWQQVDVSFQLWTEPSEPFETDFSVSESTTDATLTLTSGHRPQATDDDPGADFDVTFVAPDGREIQATREQSTDSGHVDLGSQRPDTLTTDGTYATRGGQQTVTYQLEEPEAGEWSVRIMPENTIEFEYELSRDETR